MGSVFGLAATCLQADFDACVADGDKEGAEAIYREVYELREYMNRVHAGTVWRREIPNYQAGQS